MRFRVAGSASATVISTRHRKPECPFAGIPKRSMQRADQAGTCSAIRSMRAARRGQVIAKRTFTELGLRATFPDHFVTRSSSATSPTTKRAPPRTAHPKPEDHMLPM